MNVPFIGDVMPQLGGSVGGSIALYTKRWQVPSPVRVPTGGNPSMFLSHIGVSLPHPCFSLSLPLPLKSTNISSGEDLKKEGGIMG